MDKKISRETLEHFYQNAIKSYNRCIGKEENSFLSDELGTSIFQIKTEKDSVKLKYTGTDCESFLIEVRLNLLSEDDLQLGYYVSVLGEAHEEVDDFLVFS